MRNLSALLYPKDNPKGNPKDKARVYSSGTVVAFTTFPKPART
jgi:hypothetical protein